MQKKQNRRLTKLLQIEITHAAKSCSPLNVETEQSIIALVGDKMKSHPGVSGKMFGALGRNGINVRAIAQGLSI